jgi:hypothetical protein
MIIYASNKSVKDLHRQKALTEPKLAQLDKVLHKRLLAMHSKGKFITGLMKNENTKPLHNEIKITDECTFSEGSNKLPATTYICRNWLITQNS